MSASRPSSSRLRHRIVAAAGTLALAGSLAAAGTASAQARPWQPSHRASNAGSAIHPEKLTHPGRDFAGSTVAAHFRGPAVSRAAAMVNAVSARPGIDVSAYQGNINWKNIAVYLDFVYAKATEGNSYTNPYFTNQYNGPYNAGLIRGAYHFAIPNNSSGFAQANYFMSHGGGWSGDGKTLPGALDIEYNPYGPECYGMSHSQMVSWIKSFVNEYKRKEHVYPAIYTTTDWWTTCTGNYPWYFGTRDPLWIANYTASHGGTLPRAWGFYTFWQYRDNSATLPGDQDVFNGSNYRLHVLAKKG